MSPRILPYDDIYVSTTRLAGGAGDAQMRRQRIGCTPCSKTSVTTESSAIVTLIVPAVPTHSARETRPPPKSTVSDAAKA